MSQGTNEIRRGSVTGNLMWKSVLAVSIGASLGAILRWQLGVKFNGFFNVLPLGTLVANLLGGYVVGFAIGYFAHVAEISPEWRLLIMTGFCGGLTTFSTFSAEILVLLQSGRTAWAMGAVAIHVVGSLLMTFAGLLTWEVLK